MKPIVQSGGIRERSVLERGARKLVCWLRGHHAPGMHCTRCSRRVYQ